MKASELLGAARDRLAEGWCQNRMFDHQGNTCALGALSYAAVEKGLLTFETPYVDVEIALNKVAREFGFSTIVHLNDHADTKHQDVLNAFDKAIIGLEEKGL